jgi:4-oxalocrotonate tautomerase
MPHVNVRMYPGRTVEQKRALTQRIVEAVQETLGVPEKAVTVVIEDVSPNDWNAVVVEPEIRAKKDCVFKGPENL